MNRNLTAVLAAVSVVLAVPSGGRAAAADAEPTMNQIYEAATTGHLDKAQQIVKLEARRQE
jgi:hypothetical protein